MSDDQIREGPSMTDGPPLAGDDAFREVWEKLKLSAENPRAVDVFLAWEKMRLAHNLVLAMFVFLFLGLFGVSIGFVSLLEPALVANVCFCAGLVVEGYLCLLTRERRLVRGLLFLFGTLLAILLAFFYLFAALPVVP